MKDRKMWERLAISGLLVLAGVMTGQTVIAVSGIERLMQERVVIEQVL